jgi:enamine deaminase RidA (YjgF/YER057c/UK114 family)
MTHADRPLFVNPPTLPKPPGYSQLVAVRGGTTVYIAGQVALNADGRLVGPGDFAAQTEQVFKNLELALRDRGGDLSNVIKLNSYVVDLGELARFRELRDHFIPPGPRAPASTLVQVSHLFRPEFLIEIEAVAWLPDDWGSGRCPGLS